MYQDLGPEGSPIIMQMEMNKGNKAGGRGGGGGKKGGGGGKKGGGTKKK